MNLLCSIVIFGVFLLCWLGIPEEAHAYLDLGTGSYLLQIVVGALVGGLYLLKLHWSKFRDFAKAIFSKKKKLG